MRNSGAIRLILRIACFLPLAAAPALTNWICAQPPVQRRMLGDLNPIFDALASGKPIWTNDDMRVLKEGWIARMPAGKDVLILGSSRGMEIADAWFQPRSAFNASVLTGDILDMISIFEECVETAQIPREVVLELNPSLMRDVKSDDPGPFAPYFRRALERYRLLPSLRFFAGYYSFKQVRRNAERFLIPGQRYWTERIPNSYPVLPDGSARPTPEKAMATLETFDPTPVSKGGHLANEIYHWRTTSQPGEWELNLFRRFLDDLQTRAIRITVLLAPVHPVAYDYYAKRGGYDETWIRREMASRKILVVGSYSPAITRAARSDFYDDVHPRAHVVRRLLTEAGVIGPER